MYVNYNPTSVNALHHLQTNTKNTQQTLQKLASGYAINKAADNAAGLAVSEKMRAQITGLDKAIQNARDGARLIQTGEGALQEIHTMLNRMVTLSTQSANGTYDDDVDRTELQVELDELCTEIDRIAEGTNFNGIKLFQNVSKDFETGSTEGRLQALQSREMEGQIYTAAARKDTSTGQTKSAVHVVVHDAMQTGTSTTVSYAGGNASGVTTSNDPDITINGSTTKKLSAILKDDIVPNTVNNILAAYGDAFSYLTNKQISIGLEYFQEGAQGGTTTLAYVKGGLSYSYPPNDPSQKTAKAISFTLGVNTQALNGITTRAGLSNLESTIAHEMIHAFMDEAMTAGMMGWIQNDKGFIEQSPANEFPSWFTEGMAQTASGPGNWLKHLGVSDNAGNATNKSIANINAGDKLGTGSTASQYGTGYLACMYLGAVIGGYNGTNDLAASVKGGLNKMLASIIHGNSLEGTIKNLAGFDSLSDFESAFNSNKAGSVSTVTPDQFVSKLLAATGGGRGGLASNNDTGNDGNPLNDTDLVQDGDVTGGNLKNIFQLDPGQQSIKYTPPAGEPIVTGGGAYKNGVKPNGYTAWTGTFNGGNDLLPDRDVPSGKVGGGIALQIGDTAGQLLEVKTFYLSTEALKIKDISVNKLEKADDAIDKIKAAINTVSDMRGEYGALGNRLEHTINNLSNMKENITDAESTIRDVDVAEEMMKYTKNNILMQSAQAMLSQANQVHQGVLQLIQ